MIHNRASVAWQAQDPPPVPLSVCNSASEITRWRHFCRVCFWLFRERERERERESVDKELYKLVGSLCQMRYPFVRLDFERCVQINLWRCVRDETIISSSYVWCASGGPLILNLSRRIFELSNFILELHILVNAEIIEEV